MRSFSFNPLIIILIVVAFTMLSCSVQRRAEFDPVVIYQSNLLVITQIAENSYIHTSYLQTEDFGNVPCNGLVVTSNHEAVVFDTPADDKTSALLIDRVQSMLQCKITAVIPTHFHNDCLGGLHAFDSLGIPSYAHAKTIELASKNAYAVPNNGFNDSLVLKVGTAEITARFWGEGHTVDNIVAYFPEDSILFGGCLIKEIGANKGYLGDANLSAWANTVEKVKAGYPDVKIVVPGHGQHGDKRLLDYTIRLFEAP